MKTVAITPGTSVSDPPVSLVGSVLARDLLVGGERWAKGRRLSPADVAALIAGPLARSGPWTEGRPPGEAASAPAPLVTLLIPEAGDIHEDEAAGRLAIAVAGPGLVTRGPTESRIDLVAAAAGVVVVRVAALERLNRIDGLSVFSVFDGQLVESGALVASVKTGPHLVPERSLRRAERIVAGPGGDPEPGSAPEPRSAPGRGSGPWAADGTRTAVHAGPPRPIIDVRPYRSRRIAAVVKEVLAPAARARFEAALHDKVSGTGSTLVQVRYVADAVEAIAGAFRGLTRGPDALDIVLTAGAASTDPSDAVFVAFGAIGGRVVSHGVPAHPGSMLWLGRARGVTFLGLPTCGAYSLATAADLLLPWLLAGLPPTRATVARLGHGGILSREMRFRFPAYARADHLHPDKET